MIPLLRQDKAVRPSRGKRITAIPVGGRRNQPVEAAGGSSLPRQLHAVGGSAKKNPKARTPLGINAYGVTAARGLAHESEAGAPTLWTLDRRR